MEWTSSFRTINDLPCARQMRQSLVTLYFQTSVLFQYHKYKTHKSYNLKMNGDFEKYRGHSWNKKVEFEENVGNCWLSIIFLLELLYRKIRSYIHQGISLTVCPAAAIKSLTAAQPDSSRLFLGRGPDWVSPLPPAVWVTSIISDVVENNCKGNR